MSNKYNSFAEFYPFYLSQHKDSGCRALHFVGTTFSIGWLVMALIDMNWKFVLFAIFVGYLFAWLGHFFLEKNRPATFQYPFYSLAGDFVMWWQMLTGKLK